MAGLSLCIGVPRGLPPSFRARQQHSWLDLQSFAPLAKQTSAEGGAWTSLVLKPVGYIL